MICPHGTRSEDPCPECKQEALEQVEEEYRERLRREEDARRQNQQREDRCE